MASPAQIAVLAGVATDKFQDENRQYYQDQYQKQALEAQGTLIPAATRAAAAQYGLQQASAEGQTPIVQEQAKGGLAQAKTGTAVAENQLQKLPVFLGNQDMELQTHANALKVGLAQSQLQLDELPDYLAKAQVAGAVDQSKIGMYMQGGLAQALLSGDPQVAVNYLNRLSKLKGADGKALAPVLNGREFSAVEPVQGTDASGKTSTTAFRFTPKDGSAPYEVPAAQLYQAYRQMNPAELVKMSANEKLIQRDALGNITDVSDNEIEKFRHNTVTGQIYSQKTGQPITGGIERAWNPYEEKHTAHVDQQVQKAREMLDKYMGVDIMKGLSAQDQPKYQFIAATAGQMIRKSDGKFPFEAAVNEAINEWNRQANTSAATPDLGGAPGGGGGSPAVPDFSNLFKKQ